MTPPTKCYSLNYNQTDMRRHVIYIGYIVLLFMRFKVKTSNVYQLVNTTRRSEVSSISDLALKCLKWEKSGTLSDKISVHFGSVSHNLLKPYLTKYRIGPIWGQCDSLGGQFCQPATGR